MKSTRLISFMIIGFFCFLFYPEFLLSYENKNKDYYKNPEEIINNVSKHGARRVASELYERPNAWNFILRNIAKGSKTWLKVAVALHAGSDAGASEMLTLAVGEALENEPENVFKISLEEFQLESLCVGPDIDDARYNTYELAIKAIEKRQKRISSISDPSFKKICKKCIDLLEKSKASVGRFYEKKEKEN